MKKVLMLSCFASLSVLATTGFAGEAKFTCHNDLDQTVIVEDIPNGCPQNESKVSLKAGVTVGHIESCAVEKTESSSQLVRHTYALSEQFGANSTLTVSERVFFGRGGGGRAGTIVIARNCRAECPPPVQEPGQPIAPPAGNKITSAVLVQNGQESQFYCD